MITIERADIYSAESRQLIAELWTEVDKIYGNLEPTVPDTNGMEGPGAAFLIARDEQNALGCVALRPIAPGIVEVKRMYVRPAARRGGVARRLMGELEALARAAGCQEIWLETGLGQPGAIRLYETLGYERIASFGDYARDPTSVSFGKRLQ